MAEPIVVVGAGGFGRETLDVIEAINRSADEPLWEVLGVADDSPSPENVERLHDRGYKLVGGIDAGLAQFPGVAYVVGIGSPAARCSISDSCESQGWRPATLVHPSAVIGSESAVAEGSVVCSGVQISTNVLISRHVHLNPGVIVGHDAVLKSFVSANPGAVVSGSAVIDSAALLGANCTVLQGLTVGSGSVVGAAACVTKNVPAGITVVGVPAAASPSHGRARSPESGWRV